METVAEVTLNVQVYLEGPTHTDEEIRKAAQHLLDADLLPAYLQDATVATLDWEA